MPTLKRKDAESAKDAEKNTYAETIVWFHVGKDLPDNTATVLGFREEWDEVC